MSSLYARKALLPSGWAERVRFQISAGRIVSIEQGAASEDERYQAGLVIPGFCNAHSHAFQRALVGRTERRSPAGKDNFWTWREEMYRLAGRIDTDAVHAIARQAYSEMLTAGYTTVAEFHYLHHTASEAIVSAAAETGIRLTFIPVLYERAGFDGAEPDNVQELFAMLFDDFVSTVESAKEFANDRVSVGVAAHSLRTVKEDSIDRIAELANSEKIPLHIHLAEQQQEVDDCLSNYGTRPARWLLDRCDVGEQWCLVHATHLEADEVKAIAQSGAVVCLCPSTEANLGDGLFPLQAYLDEGGRMAIGSDSQVTIDPFEELRWLEYGQRLATQSRNVAPCGVAMLDLVNGGGVQACGQGTGKLEIGAPADLLSLDDADPVLLGHDESTLIDAVVFSGYRVPVDRVMVHGEWKVMDGRHVDAGDVIRQYRQAIGTMQ